jgi:hypothetical protein
MNTYIQSTCKYVKYLLNFGENVVPIVLYIVHLGEIWVTLGFCTNLGTIYAQSGTCSYVANRTKIWGSLDLCYSLLKYCTWPKVDFYNFEILRFPPDDPQKDPLNLCSAGSNARPIQSIECRESTIPQSSIVKQNPIDAQENPFGVYTNQIKLN